jgi:hypothetical protein
LCARLSQTMQVSGPCPPHRWARALPASQQDDQQQQGQPQGCGDERDDGHGQQDPGVDQREEACAQAGRGGGGRQARSKQVSSVRAAGQQVRALRAGHGIQRQKSAGVAVHMRAAAWFWRPDAAEEVHACGLWELSAQCAASHWECVGHERLHQLPLSPSELGAECPHMMSDACRTLPQPASTALPAPARTCQQHHRHPDGGGDEGEGDPQGRGQHRQHNAHQAQPVLHAPEEAANRAYSAVAGPMAAGTSWGRGIGTVHRGASGGRG